MDILEADETGLYTVQKENVENASYDKKQCDEIYARYLKGSTLKNVQPRIEDEYFRMPEPIDKEQFMQITKRIHDLVSLVLCPLGFPDSIYTIEDLSRFKQRCSGLLQTTIGVVSDFVYGQNNVNESIMASSAHLYLKQQKDTDCQSKVNEIQNVLLELYDVPRVVEIPEILESEMVHVVQLIRKTMQDEKVKDVAIHGDGWGNVYPGLVYQLGYLPKQVECKLPSHLQLKSKIRQRCKVFCSILENRNVKVMSGVVMQALLDSSSAQKDINTVVQGVHREDHLLLDQQSEEDLNDATVKDCIQKAQAKLQYYDDEAAILILLEALAVLPIFHYGVSKICTILASCYKNRNSLDKAKYYCMLACRVNPTSKEAYVMLADIISKQDDAKVELEYTLELYTTAFILDGCQDMNIASTVEELSKELGRKEAWPVYQSKTRLDTLPAEWLIDSFFDAFVDKEYFGRRNLDRSIVVEEDRNILSDEQLLTRAFYFKVQKKYQDSFEDCRCLLDRPSAQNLAGLHNLYGSFLYVSGHLEAGLKQIETCLAIAPESTNALVKKGIMLGELSQLEEAFETFDVALKVNGGSSDAYMHRGQLKILSGDSQGAITDLKQSLNLNDSNPLAHVTYGMALYRCDIYHRAVKVFKDAQERFPKDPVLPLFYGEVLSEMGDFSEAMVQFQIAREGLPTCPLPWLNAARAYVSMNDPEMAIKHFEMATQLDDRCSPAHMDMAQAYFAQGNATTASEHFDLAVQYARFLPEIEDACGARAMAHAQLSVTEKLGVDLRQLLKATNASSF